MSIISSKKEFVNSPFEEEEYLKKEIAALGYNISIDDFSKLELPHDKDSDFQNSFLDIQKKAKILALKQNNIKNTESSGNYFQELLENNSEAKLIEELKNISSGVNTGYNIGTLDLTLPGGAISILAAPTSHGKTSVMINFMINILENHKNISGYFFSYEESSAHILTSFLNTYYHKQTNNNNIQLSKNCRKSIISYFRDHSDKYIESDQKNLFEKNKEKFFKELIDTGRLKVIYSTLNTEELTEAIYFLKKNTNIGFICIDYMQLLRLSTSSYGGRQEELKKICLLLKDCAVETGLPILIAAQFNRTVNTEKSLSYLNIGEAGDIERVASLIIGMYNRNFILSPNGNESKQSEKIDKEPKIYFEILKGRGIGSDYSCIMDFDGNRGKLTNTIHSILSDHDKKLEVSNQENMKLNYTSLINNSSKRLGKKYEKSF